MTPEQTHTEAIRASIWVNETHPTIRFTNCGDSRWVRSRLDLEGSGIIVSDQDVIDEAVEMRWPMNDHEQARKCAEWLNKPHVVRVEWSELYECWYVHTPSKMSRKTDSELIAEATRLGYVDLDHLPEDNHG